MKVFNIWATLLNDFYLYQTEAGYDKGDDFIPFVSESQLIDKINRVPFEPTEAMEKGSAFEKAIYINEPTVQRGEGKEFKFDADLVKSMHHFVKGSTYQKGLVYSFLMDDFKINLYGYSDFISRDTIIDLKTTSSYSFPKFDKSFQHKVYLMGANQMGIFVNKFNYLVTDFREYYYELYPYDPYLYENELKVICSDLIGFMESRKLLITNTDINREDYLNDRLDLIYF
jgi:hypothetical protein